ncbi:nuclear transport factor 2 family protein [Candidatus Phycosocius spiralis]|uniref:SnoaL-like domain-containing protein n=1 Tax=Candidatus Phycosocius spiralis TaxID=2815099 RepID=A0ABQ4PW60_9PROT|nr:nuclear transport factor 2 family protein [Candidatus Phycosocius spiralis]GIU67289.1 hypothetical protein PsB1_1443 [Candidatus Phycosocius spiralis]
MTAIVDKNYAAYAANDLEGILATLAEDYTVLPFGGAPWVTSREGARKIYARHLVDYPMARTQVLGRIDLGKVTIKREHSEPAEGSKAPTVDVMMIYTVRDGLIARCESITRAGDEEAAVGVIAAQLDAYNVQDLDAHVACFAEDVVIADLNGAENLHGITDYRARYQGVFEQFPANHAHLDQRLACGNVVVDHERVRRSPDSEPFEVLAIYTVRDGKIARVDFVK